MPGHDLNQGIDLLKDMKTLKILIPVDFSPTFQFAAAMTELVRNNQSAEVFLLHVVPATGNKEDLEDAEEMVQKQTQTAYNWFEALPAKFDFKGFVKVGPVTQTINNFAVEIGADLIVMGTKGANGLKEFISGSEAQHVVRYSAVPVITVLGNYLPAKLQNILVVSDFQTVREHTPLNLVKTFAAPEAKMHLLHILTPTELNQVVQIKKIMQDFANLNGLKNTELHVHHENAVEQGIYQFNKDHEMDLVCMGTHARKGLSHLFYGSIAERLINHCSKPVLTYHL